MQLSKMEQDGIKFSDLPADVLHHIIARLAMSDEGATNFARAISVYVPRLSYFPQIYIFFSLI